MAGPARQLCRSNGTPLPFRHRSVYWVRAPINTRSNLSEGCSDINIGEATSRFAAFHDTTRAQSDSFVSVVLEGFFLLAVVAWSLKILCVWSFLLLVASKSSFILVYLWAACLVVYCKRLSCKRLSRCYIVNHVQFQHTLQSIINSLMNSYFEEIFFCSCRWAQTTLQL